MEKNKSVRPALPGHIVTEDRILSNHCLHIEEGKIASIEPDAADVPDSGEEATYILPGFRDQHIHDLIGQQMAETHTEEEVVQRFEVTLTSLGRRGVTGVYIATFGNPFDNLERYGRAARAWMENSDNGLTGAKLLGLNIEGSFLNVECRGAQPAEYIITPERDDCIRAIDRLCATGAVKIINIVPDYGDLSLQAMRHAADLGLLVGSGHLKPPAELLRRAYEESGLKFMVHFTNGPTGQSFKPFGGGGAFEGAMDLPLSKELIVDRAHIDERYVLDIIHRTEQRWGEDKIITVADAIFPTPDEIPQGEFRIGSTIARLSEGGRCLVTAAYEQPDGSVVPAPPNTLCGSILTMDRAYGNLLTILTQPIRGHWFDHPGMSLEAALVKASKLCSTNQAKLDGSYRTTGSLEPGKAADLAVTKLKKEGNEYSLDIQEVYVGGVRVYEARESKFGYL